MELQSGVLTYQDNEVHLLRVGTGSKLLIAFHGFGNDAALFLPLAYALKDEYTTISVDLPGHGKTKWKDSYFTPKDLMAVVNGIREKFSVERFTLIGYSLGGRVCLQIAQLQPQWVDKLVLVAPDGLVRNFWYGFATRNPIGKSLFKKLLANPDKWMDSFAWLHKYKLIDASKFKFAKHQLKDEQVLQQLGYVWPVTSKIKIHIAALKWLLNKHKVFTAIVMGRHDRIFPPKQAEQFLKGIKQSSLKVLDTGHNLVTSQFLPQIIEAVTGVVQQP